MVKRLFMLLFLLGCLTGCTINTLSDHEFDALSEDKIIEGRVIEIKKNNLILSIDEGSNWGSGEIHVSTQEAKTEENITKGQNLKIWFSYIRESYPPQTNALKIEIK